MADYWKSLPRYYCESCNAYMADNKVTREKHEQGRRHQENVEQRLRQIRMKTMQEEREKQVMDECLRKMNEGAAKGLKAAGVASDADDAEAVAIATKPISGYMRGDDSMPEEPKPAEASEETVDDWQEATTPDGRIYFWNKVTRETRWAKPKPKLIGPAVPQPRPQKSSKIRLLGAKAQQQSDASNKPPITAQSAPNPAPAQPITAQGGPNPAPAQPITAQSAPNPAPAQPITAQAVPSPATARPITAQPAINLPNKQPITKQRADKSTDKEPVTEKQAAKTAEQQPITEEQPVELTQLQPITEHESSSGLGQWTAVIPATSAHSSAPVVPAKQRPKFHFEEKTLSSGSLKRPGDRQDACTFKKRQGTAGGSFTRITSE